MKRLTTISGRTSLLLPAVLLLSGLFLYPMSAAEPGGGGEAEKGEKDVRLKPTQTVGYTLGGGSTGTKGMIVNSDSRRGAVRFELPKDLNVARAELRLYANGKISKSGPWTLLVCPALDDWDEQSLGKGDGPAFGSPLAISVAPESGVGWQSVDVTDFVAEEATKDGKFSFRLLTLNVGGEYEGNKGEHAPELVITPGSGSAKPVPSKEPPYVLEELKKTEADEKTDDWPQFLGPNRNGVTTTSLKLAESWPENGPPVLWTCDLGTPRRQFSLTRYSGPVVRDGRVYILDSDERGAQELIRCLDLETGKELWKYAYDQPVFRVGHGFFHSEGNTPNVDDARVYTFGPDGNLTCLDRMTGALLWSHKYIRETENRPGGSREEWTDFANGVSKGGGYGPDSQGYAQCPLLYGRAVIVAPQRSDAGLAAHDRQTGEIIWKSPSIAGITQTSPTLLNVEGRDVILMFGRHCSSVENSRYDGLYVVDPRNGALILYVRLPGKKYCMMGSITALSEGRAVWPGQHFHHFTSMLQFRQHQGSLYAVEVWTQFPMRSKVSLHPIIAYQDHLFLSEQHHSGGSKYGFACLDFKGKVAWASWTPENIERNTALRFGNMSPFIIVNDRIFILNDSVEEGKEGFALAMIAADPGQYRLLDTCTGFTKEEMRFRPMGDRDWARTKPMAFSRGRLLAAFCGQLRCWDLTEPETR